MILVSDRPYVLLSCAMSVDGFIDDASPQRLRLSNLADFDRVDGVRAHCDAILVGARTIRRDNPELLLRSTARREDRISRGLPPDLTKVTLTSGRDLDPNARFFTSGDAPKLVYCASPGVRDLKSRLNGHAEIIDAGDPVSLPDALADLAIRGVRRLMVEGGGGIHTQFLVAGLVDEVQLVVAPFFVGDPSAPRFVQPGVFPQSARHPMRLAGATRIGDMVLLRYLIGHEHG
jgi:riboflavin-specific deaminase-like protein